MPATTTSSRYRDQWESPRHPAWSDFWRNHWGTRGRALLDDVLRRPPLERFLDVRPVSALTMLDVPTVTTRGSPFKLLVREEMLRFAQRFRDARDMPGQAIEGVVLLGQSGIGKTALLVFFLLQCLSMEERVVLAMRYGGTYLFDECGVAALKSKSTSGFVAIEHLPGHVDNAPRLWSLVDCPLSPAPSPSSVTLDARPRMFFVAVLSPDESRRYKPFEGEPGIRAWWMSRWSDDELLALYLSAYT